MPPGSRFDLAHVGFVGVDRPSGRQRASQPLVSVRGRSVDVRPAPGDDDACTGFPLWVLGRAGMDPAVYRGTPLQRRVPACLRALHARSELHAQELLSTRPELISVALDTLLIGVTDFFRDSSVFDDIAGAVIPALAACNGPLRVWSVGCSSGAELFSLAALLAEQRLLDRAELVGTDCRRDAIREAEAALYPAEALAGMSAAVRGRYFERVGGDWRPVPQLRRAVRWRAADFVREVEPGAWDVIACRNVLIYMARDAANAAIERLVDVLRPGGFLIVGKAEALPGAAPLRRLSRCIYRKDGS